GNYDIHISSLGYMDTIISVFLKKDESLNIKIRLSGTIVELEKVMIRSSLRKNYVETNPSASLRLNLPFIEIPQNIEVTTHCLISDQGLLSMSEAIRTVSGIEKTYSSLNDYTLIIRGTDANWNVFRNG